MACAIGRLALDRELDRLDASYREVLVAAVAAAAQRSGLTARTWETAAKDAP